MEVKNCKNCGRLYNYIGGVYRLCPECMRKLEEKFQEVKDYIEEKYLRIAMSVQDRLNSG